MWLRVAAPRDGENLGGQGAALASGASVRGTTACPPAVALLLQSCGAELFTGNTAVLTAAVYEGKATFKQLLKSWVSWAGCGGQRHGGGWGSAAGR